LTRQRGGQVAVVQLVGQVCTLLLGLIRVPWRNATHTRTHEHLTAHTMVPAGSETPAEHPELVRGHGAWSLGEVVAPTTSWQPHPLCMYHSERAEARTVRQSMASTVEYCRVLSSTVVHCREVPTQQNSGYDSVVERWCGGTGLPDERASGRSVTCHSQDVQRTHQAAVHRWRSSCAATRSDTHERQRSRQIVLS
jgi:hypothetical protein